MSTGSICGVEDANRQSNNTHSDGECCDFCSIVKLACLLRCGSCCGTLARTLAWWPWLQPFPPPPHLSLKQVPGNFLGSKCDLHNIYHITHWTEIGMKIRGQHHISKVPDSMKRGPLLTLVGWVSVCVHVSVCVCVHVSVCVIPCSFMFALTSWQPSFRTLPKTSATKGWDFRIVKLGRFLIWHEVLYCSESNGKVLHITIS